MKRGRSNGAFQSQGIYDSERLCDAATQGPIGNSRRRGSIGEILGISSFSASSSAALIDVHPCIQDLRIWRGHLVETTLRTSGGFESGESGEIHGL